MKKLTFSWAVSVIAVLIFGMGYQVSAQDLSSYEKANINWQQFKGTELLLAMATLPTQQALQPLLGDFEQLTGMKVTFDTYGEVALSDKLTLDLSSGAGRYDAFMLALYWIPPWGAQGWLEDIYPYVNDPQLTDKAWYDIDDFYPGLLEIGKGIDAALPKPWGTPDKLYGPPTTGQATVLMYRKDLLAERGLPAPTTLDALYNAALKLNTDEDGDGKIDIYGYNMRMGKGVGMNTGVWLNMLMSFGGRMFDSQWRPALNSPAGVQALEYFKKLGEDAVAPAAQNWSYADCLAFMAEGKAAMWGDMADAAIALDDPGMSKVVGKIGFSSPPKGPGGAKVGGWTWLLGMNPKGKNKKATWLFLQWASSKPTMSRMKLATPRKSVAASAQYAEWFPKDWIEASNIALSADYLAHWFGPIIPESMELMDIMSGKIQETTLGQKGAKQALDEAAVEWEKILDRAGYYD